ncbi:NAD(P)H-dependent oxidoreductase [Aureimonas fodinaquatilis]|uniref:NAD(P)H-dependent oxidoreductase n=1 Tax=Aureimonas fodinaquatilis TaxID=2565783 RepID=A0A5B0DWQ6_9HYPH|nr:NADPH-dependent FMN reductase [Aureimonas fodinaquatilis]KAA0970432.1 NAD(P)H-dependent oxidoreductase [Aureimonas fodinaquatilis]
MVKLLGISGSLRAQSFNTALMRAAAVPARSHAEYTYTTLEGIPLYNADVETREGIPAAVESLKTAIANADGVLFFTPEYNNSLPGVFKNAIDWASRPASDIKRVFGGKPVAVLGASMGNFGTVLSQNAWLPVIRTLGMEPWFEGRLMLSRAQDVFDEAGELNDAKTVRKLEEFIGGFAEFVSRR